MEEMTVSQVSRSVGISTRMLRYYEKVGLIKSSRQEGYSYRVYDENAVSRIKQILILRKLRIPVRQIEVILNNTNAVAAIDIFRQNMEELDEEITALSTIRDILNHFVEELSRTTELPLEDIMPKDDAVLAAIESLGIISINFKEEQSGEKLKKADEQLSKINDVRILYLPPAAVAVSHYVGDEPELHANSLLDNFANEKYIGDALLQKTYTVDFLTQKRVSNNGIVPQYYVENSHPAIIPVTFLCRCRKKFSAGQTSTAVQSERSESTAVVTLRPALWYVDTAEKFFAESNGTTAGAKLRCGDVSAGWKKAVPIARQGQSGKKSCKRLW